MYKRRKSNPVHVGGLLLGGDNPIRVQSMANTSTMDTEGSVAQALRIVEAGGEIVRFTTQGRREALNMQNIKNGIRAAGCDVPLVADVHFNAAVADIAATICEKVRINPGNYVDPGRVFKKIVYTDEEYADEIKKLEAKYGPLIEGQHLTVQLQNLLALVPRARRRIDAYNGLVKELANRGVTLTIKSRKSK